MSNIETLLETADVTKIVLDGIVVHHNPDADCGFTYWDYQRHAGDYIKNIHTAPIILGDPKEPGVYLRIDQDKKKGADILTEIDKEQNKDLAELVGVLDASHGHRIRTDEPESKWELSSAGMGYLNLHEKRGRKPSRGYMIVMEFVHRDDVWGEKTKLKKRKYTPFHPILCLPKHTKRGQHLGYNQDGQPRAVPAEEALNMDCTMFDAIVHMIDSDPDASPNTLDITEVIAEWICEYYERVNRLPRLEDLREDTLRKRKVYGEAWSDPRVAAEEYLEGYMAERTFARILEFCENPEFPLKSPDQKWFTLPGIMTAVYHYKRDVENVDHPMEEAKAFAKRLFDSSVRLMEDYERSVDEVRAVQERAMKQAKAGYGNPDWQARNGLVIIRGLSRQTQFASVAFKHADADIVMVYNEEGDIRFLWRFPRGTNKGMRARKIALAISVVRQIMRWWRVDEFEARGREDLAFSVNLNLPADYTEEHPDYPDPIFNFVPPKWMPEKMKDGIPLTLWGLSKGTLIGPDGLWNIIIAVLMGWVPPACFYRLADGTKESLKKAHCSEKCPYFRADLHGCRIMRLSSHSGADATEADIQWNERRLARRKLRVDDGHISASKEEDLLAEELIHALGLIFHDAPQGKGAPLPPDADDLLSEEETDPGLVKTDPGNDDPEDDEDPDDEDPDDEDPDDDPDGGPDGGGEPNERDEEREKSDLVVGVVLDSAKTEHAARTLVEVEFEEDESDHRSVGAICPADARSVPATPVVNIAIGPIPDSNPSWTFHEHREAPVVEREGPDLSDFLEEIGEYSDGYTEAYPELDERDLVLEVDDVSHRISEANDLVDEVPHEMRSATIVSEGSLDLEEIVEDEPTEQGMYLVSPDSETDSEITHSSIVPLVTEDGWNPDALGYERHAQIVAK